ncbi:MAG TPA: diguanylate cyclase [Blastocatellia bacterium]|nr:diguanylate cyclase [Blastocatellia bacterium]
MKILIAEDNHVSACLLERALSAWGYEVTIARSGTEAWAALSREDGPKMAILDWVMPGMDGIEVCREVRKLAREPYPYLLLLTSKEDEADVVAGLEAGADDFVTKPFRPLELRARLGTGRRLLRLQDALIAAREEVRMLATHDVLTGIWNRRAIMDHLSSELSRCGRHRLPIGVIMGDLDHFKQINDTFGHAAGDAVLQEAASRIKSSLRPYDATGRYGGEEFLIVVPECTVTGVTSVAERILATFRNRPFSLSGEAHAVTISLGIAACSLASARQMELVLEVADQALYRAKSAGRDRFELTEFQH